MRIYLFDTDSVRRNLWNSCCSEHAVECEILIDLAGAILQPTPTVRIFVLDISQFGESLTHVENLLNVLRREVIAISIPTPSALQVMQLMDLGVHRVLDQELNRSDLGHHLRALIQQAQSLDLKLKRFLHLKQKLSSITRKEKDVLEFMVRGIRNQQISEHLSISVRTVETRRANLMRKCNVDNVVDLVREIDEYYALQKLFG